MNAKRVEPVEEVVEEVQHEFEEFQKDWWIFLLLGFVLFICGALAISFPHLGLGAVILVLGVTLMVAGIALIINSFWTRKWSGFFLHVLVGIFYTVVGFAIIDSPVESVLVLTLLLAAFFIVIGIVRIVVSLVERFPQWGWALLNGIVTLLAGIIIYRVMEANPIAALWIIGLLIGIDLIFQGVTWIMLSLQIKNLPDLASGEDETS